MKLDGGEMTFTVKNADMDKLYEVLKDINIKKSPYFEISDKYGNTARYYRDDSETHEKRTETHEKRTETHGCDYTSGKIGFWMTIERGENGYSAGDFRCSVCGKPCPCYHSTKFCPNCGADMRGCRT